MKKQLLFLAFSLIFSLKSFSQIIFEKGYFIDDSNNKTECLIKNIDWKNNPTEFEYKLSPNATAQKASIETVKEFGINDVSKYRRAHVKIDRSSDEISNLSSERIPRFQEESLFLKVLIEGQASLFLYEGSNLRRFFYSIKDSEIEQLIYKRYLLDNKVAQNNYFKQQLFNELKCQGSTLKDVENLKYVTSGLKRFFIKYNECTDSGYIDYELKRRKLLFNLSLRPGLNYSSLAMQNSQSNFGKNDFDNDFNFRFGIEAEFILPFNKNKWGLIIEPTYQYYKSENTTETNSISGGILVSKVDYQSVELPIGVRHYFFLNDESKIFADLSYIIDYSTNSSVEFRRSDGSLINTLEVSSRRNLGVGVGYKYLDRYSISMRYQTEREIFGDYVYWDSGYKTVSVIFGYSLF